VRLQDLLTRHKQVVAQFLQDNFTRFFDAFSALLQSNNYVTRRQSLKVRAGWEPAAAVHLDSSHDSRAWQQHA
jgi:hypothetical protein